MRYCTNFYWQQFSEYCTRYLCCLSCFKFHWFTWQGSWRGESPGTTCSGWGLCWVPLWSHLSISRLIRTWHRCLQTQTQSRWFSRIDFITYCDFFYLYLALSYFRRVGVVIVIVIVRFRFIFRVIENHNYVWKNNGWTLWLFACLILWSVSIVLLLLDYALDKREFLKASPSCNLWFLHFLLSLFQQLNLLDLNSHL